MQSTCTVAKKIFGQLEDGDDVDIGNFRLDFDDEEDTSDSSDDFADEEDTSSSSSAS